MRHQENLQSESHLQCDHRLNADFIGYNKNGQYQLMCSKKCLEETKSKVTSLITFKEQFETVQQEFKEIDDLKDDLIKLINFLQNNQNQNFVSNTIHCIDLQKQSLDKNQAFSELRQQELLDIFQKMQGQFYQNCINDIRKSFKEIPRDFFFTLQAMLKVIQNILSFFKQNSILYDTQLFEKQIRKEKQEFDYNQLNEIKCEQHKLNFSLIDLEEKSQKRALCPGCDYSLGSSSSLQKYIEDNIDAFQTNNNQIFIKKQERINAFLEILESHSRISNSYSHKLLQILNESQICYSVDNETKLQVFCQKIISFKSLNEITQYFEFEKQLYSQLDEFFQQFKKFFKQMENFYDQKKKQVEVQEAQVFFSKVKNKNELNLISVVINQKFLILVFNKLIQFICLEDQSNKKELGLKFDIKQYCFQLENELIAVSDNQLVEIYQISKQQQKILLQDQLQMKNGIVKLLFIVKNKTKKYYCAIVCQKIITVLIGKNQIETFGKIDEMSSETYYDAKGTENFLICARKNTKDIIVNLTIFPLNYWKSSFKQELKNNFRQFQIFSEKEKKLQLLLFFDNQLQLLTFNSNGYLGTKAIKLDIDLNQNIYHCPFNKSQIVLFSEEKIDFFQISEQSQNKFKSTSSPKILYNKFSQKQQCETNNFTIYEDYVLCLNQMDINVLQNIIYIIAFYPSCLKQKSQNDQILYHKNNSILVRQKQFFLNRAIPFQLKRKTYIAILLLFKQLNQKMNQLSQSRGEVQEQWGLKIKCPLNQDEYITTVSIHASNNKEVQRLFCQKCQPVCIISRNLEFVKQEYFKYLSQTEKENYLFTNQLENVILTLQKIESDMDLKLESLSKECIPFFKKYLEKPKPFEEFNYEDLKKFVQYICLDQKDRQKISQKNQEKTSDDKNEIIQYIKIDQRGVFEKLYQFKTILDQLFFFIDILEKSNKIRQKEQTPSSRYSQNSWNSQSQYSKRQSEIQQESFFDDEQQLTNNITCLKHVNNFITKLNMGPQKAQRLFCDQCRESDQDKNSPFINFQNLKTTIQNPFDEIYKQNFSRLEDIIQSIIFQLQESNHILDSLQFENQLLEEKLEEIKFCLNDYKSQTQIKSNQQLSFLAEDWYEKFYSKNQPQEVNISATLQNQAFAFLNTLNDQFNEAISNQLTNSIELKQELEAKIFDQKNNCNCLKQLFEAGIIKSVHFSKDKKQLFLVRSYSVIIYNYQNDTNKLNYSQTIYFTKLINQFRNASDCFFINFQQDQKFIIYQKQQNNFIKIKKEFISETIVIDFFITENGDKINIYIISDQLFTFMVYEKNKNVNFVGKNFLKNSNQKYIMYFDSQSQFVLFFGNTPFLIQLLNNQKYLFKTFQILESLIDSTEIPKCITALRNIKKPQTQGNKQQDEHIFYGLSNKNFSTLKFKFSKVEQQFEIPCQFTKQPFPNEIQFFQFHENNLFTIEYEEGEISFKLREMDDIITLKKMTKKKKKSTILALLYCDNWNIEYLYQKEGCRIKIGNMYKFYYNRYTQELQKQDIKGKTLWNSK